MSIEYAIDYDADGQLTVYRGETRNQESVLYKIEKGTVIGEDSCYVRTYPDKRIAYTAVADPSYPGSYRIYEGDDYTYGGAPENTSEASHGDERTVSVTVTGNDETSAEEDTVYEPEYTVIDRH